MGNPIMQLYILFACVCFMSFQFATPTHDIRHKRQAQSTQQSSITAIPTTPGIPPAGNIGIATQPEITSPGSVTSPLTPGIFNIPQANTPTTDALTPAPSLPIGILTTPEAATNPPGVAGPPQANPVATTPPVATSLPGTVSSQQVTTPTIDTTPPGAAVATEQTTVPASITLPGAVVPKQAVDPTSVTHTAGIEIPQQASTPSAVTPPSGATSAQQAVAPDATTPPKATISPVVEAPQQATTPSVATTPHQATPPPAAAVNPEAVTTFQSSNTTDPQAVLDEIANTLDVRLKVVDNLEFDGKKHKIQVTFKNMGNETIFGNQFDIYFYSFSMIEPDTLPSESGYIDNDYKIRIDHIAGSLFRLKFLPDFAAITFNESRVVQFYAKDWSVSKTDFPPNWYIVSTGLEPRVIKSTAGVNPDFVEEFTSAKSWKRFKKDKYNPHTANDRYDRFLTDPPTLSDIQVIPTPLSLLRFKNPYDPEIDLSKGPWEVIGTSDLENEVTYLSEKLNISKTFVEKIQEAENRTSKVFKLHLEPEFQGTPDKYRINANRNVQKGLEYIEIKGGAASGVFYGIQTMLSVVDDGHNMTFEEFLIIDGPRFTHRGMHLDIARNFFNKDDIMRVITVMARYKLNVLQLQLSDDEGWRIEIDALREMIEKASQRCHGNYTAKCILPQLGSGPFNNTSGSGFLSVRDYVEIQAHARKNHVQIIPYINTPAHAHAAIKAMQNSPGLQREYNLRETISGYLSPQMYNDSVIDHCKSRETTFIRDVLTSFHRAPINSSIIHFGGFDDLPLEPWSAMSCTPMDIDDLRLLFLSDTIDAFGNIYIIITTAGVLMKGESSLFEMRPFYTKYLIGHYWDNIWEHKKFGSAYKLANAGHKVILSPVSHLHFDHPHEPDPEERGRSSSIRYIDTKKVFQFVPGDLYANIRTKLSGENITRQEVCNDTKLCPELQIPGNILGIQGMLWTQTIMSREHLDHMLFPRMLALAERAWHKAGWENDISQVKAMENDWTNFAEVVGRKELKRLDRLGILYRISPPGARAFDDKFIKTTTEFPGQTVEFSTNSGKTWKPAPGNWSLDVQNNRILLRTRVQEGRIKTNTDFMGQSMEFSLDKGKTWKVVPKTWPIASYNPILLRTRSLDKLRTSRAVEFDPRGENPIPDQDDINYIANNLQVFYKVINNLNQKNDFFLFKLSFFNNGGKEIQHGNWSIHFFSIRLLEPDHFPYRNGYLLHDCGLWLHHMGGSLYRLEPEYSEFKLPSQKSVTCLFRGKYWQVARTDIMPNWYVTAEGMEPKVIESTRGENLNFVQPFSTPNTWKRFPDDQYNPFTSLQRYNKNADVTDQGRATLPVIPQPRNISINDGFLVVRVDEWTVVGIDEFQNEMRMIAEYFQANISTASNKKVVKVIVLTKDVPAANNSTEQENYELIISATDERIDIKSPSSSGIFYALQSLKSLSTDVIGVGRRLPSVNIVDSPRFRYRGVHLDVARNFHTKEEVLKLLDIMSRYKLNKFHFHLSDDEGWRLEIPGLPELTKVGAHRCHDPEEVHCLFPQLGSGPTVNSSGSGFYTVEDYQEIVRYATKRHIEIIPEFDTPGHSRAAIKAMESRYDKFMKNKMKKEAMEYLLTEVDENVDMMTHQWFRHNMINPCISSTYRFITHVIRQLKAMVQDIAPLKTYHIGGPGGDDFTTDVWNNSKLCHKFVEPYEINTIPLIFLNRIGSLVLKEIFDLAMWEDTIIIGDTPFDRRVLPPKPSKMYGYVWKNVWEWGVADNAHKLANADFKVVLAHATHLFFDHPYEPDPEERGYYWAARYTDTRKVFGFTPDNILWNADTTVDGVSVPKDDLCKKPGCEKLLKPENIEGMQAQIWTETIRQENQLHEMAFPRLIAMAERAWHKASWEDTADVVTRHKMRDAEWESFANTIGYREMLELDAKGIRYRIPLPGAKLVNGTLRVNVAFPGLSIEYSLNNKENWTKITGTVNVAGSWIIYLRTRSADLSRTSRVIFVRPALLYNYRPYWLAPYHRRYIKYLTNS